MSRLFVFLALALATGFARADVPPMAGYKLPVPEIETLPNGLKLIWFQSDALPVIDLVLVVRSGARSEPLGKSGTSELVSELLDRGSSQSPGPSGPGYAMDAQQIAHAVERLGASRYSSVDEDMYTVGMHGLAPDASTLLDLFAKITLHPDFPAPEVAKEHERMADQWSHMSDYGETMATLAFHRIVAAGTPYGRGTFLSTKEFGQVTRDDVVNAYQREFHPDNSVLMVVGRVDRPAFRKQIDASFGAWQNPSAATQQAPVPYTDRRLVPTAKLPKGIAPGRGEVLIVDRPELSQAQVRIGFRAPTIQAPDHYALTVMNALLGEYFNSRLNSLIRDKLGLTYSISSSYSYMKDFATFTVASATRNETVGQLVHKTIEVLRDLKNGPIEPEEVTTAKEYLIGGFPLSTSTLSAIAARWLSGYVFDLGPTYLNEFVPKVSAVTADDVTRALGNDFDLDNATVVIAGDAKQIVPAVTPVLKLLQQQKKGQRWKIRTIKAGDIL